MNFYDFTLKDWQGNDVPLKNYAGKVVMVVNTATRCGFTPQYKELEELYERYHDAGLEILDVPCNQFADQAPESDAGVCEFRSGFNAKFPQMKKSDVNGENALPLYAWMKAQKGFEGFGSGDMAEKLPGILSGIDPNFNMETPDIKWNFTKFLIDKAGNVAARFEPTHDMALVESAVATLL